MTTSSTAIPFWIGFFLFSVYLLSFSGKFHVMDEVAVFTAGHNLAQHSRADINQLIWTHHWTPNPPGIWGRDGNLYTKKAPGISFITAPLIWLGHTLPELNAVHVGLLTNSFITALTAVLLYIWLLDLAFTRTTATLTALGFGLCTIAWIYARMFWESSILALSFLTAVWAVYRATRLAYARQRLFWIILGGAAVALGLTLRFETVPAVVFIGLYLVWESASWRIRQLIRPGPTIDLKRTTYQPVSPAQMLGGLVYAFPWGRLIVYMAPIILIVMGLLYFNLARFGSLGETGYSRELLFRAPWVGGFGLLFSPGRGLFIYAPLMLLLFFGLRPAWRRLSRPYFWLIAVICLFYWLFYGAWFAWGGTWGWGPRFLLPILPLLMLFVAEPIEWARQQIGKARTANTWSSEVGRHTARSPSPVPRPPFHVSSATVAWLGIGLLAVLSLLVNLLGIAVDFNEHFLRLGTNDNFVFNWAAFPPRAHWRIFQEGFNDIIWLGDGFAIEWSVLTPALILFLLSAIGLVLTLRNEKLKRADQRGYYNNASLRGRTASPVHRPSIPASRFTIFVLLVVFLPPSLIYQMMVGTARVALKDEQAQADLAVLETLQSAAQAGDVLLIPMPPYGDVQEISTRTMAYLDQPVPVSAWIESPPRAIQPAEREQLWRAAMTHAGRVWLFERWLTPSSPTNPTTARLNREGFFLHSQWFERSGKLSLYAVGADPDPTAPVTMNVPFQGGLMLVDFTLFDSTVRADNEVLRLRLTWQAAAGGEVAAQDLPAAQVVAFVQLLDAGAAVNVAQTDRILVDLQRVEQSPLLPGQMIQQGYGLRLPDDLPVGSYPLVAGLYQAGTGRRLSRADGSPDDFLYLTTVVVE